MCLLDFPEQNAEHGLMRGKLCDNDNVSIKYGNEHSNSSCLGFFNTGSSWMLESINTAFCRINNTPLLKKNRAASTFTVRVYSTEPSHYTTFAS